MSGSVADKKRLLKISADDLSRHHLSIDGNHDFFPPKGRCKGIEKRFEILLDGLNTKVKAKLATNGTVGHFHDEWVKDFFVHHRIRTGDVLAMERIGVSEYRLYPFESKSDRTDDWRELIAKPLKGIVIDAFDRLAAKNVDFADALLASQASKMGIDVASFDRDLDKFPDVRRYQP